MSEEETDGSGLYEPMQAADGSGLYETMHAPQETARSSENLLYDTSERQSLTGSAARSSYNPLYGTTN